MDNAIRLMLLKAEKEGNKKHLVDAFEKLQCGRKLTTAQSDPFSSDLYVISAEVALQVGELKIVDECIKLYFQKTPPNNQFLCRAYFCQARLNAPISSKDEDKLEISTGFLLKAISYAKLNSRYHFLVYNASVLYWTFARPFLKPNYRYLLAKSLYAIVKALEDVNETDFEWRAQLMVALLECHIDAGRRDDAVHIAQNALQFTKLHVPHMVKEVFRLQLRYKIIDPAKVTSITKSSSELAICHKLHKIKSASDPSSLQMEIELEKILHFIVFGQIEQDGRTSNVSRTVERQPLSAQERNSLLIDLIRTCLEMDQPGVAEKSIHKSHMFLHDTSLTLELEFMRCELMVKTLKERSNDYSKTSIDIRVNAINTLEEHLKSAYRMHNEDLIQVGCNTLWNLCLPLLQHNLRHKIRKSLTTAVQMLDEIDSHMMLLRCQMHYEVAKCLEDNEQLQSALNHLLKAIQFDETNSYKIRLENSLKRLKMKSLLYQVPERPEDHAAMIIEQAEATTKCLPSEIRTYLSKAGAMLSPDSFNVAMDAENALIGSKPNLLSIEKLEEKMDRYTKGMAKLENHLNLLPADNSEERMMLWADLAKGARKQKIWDVTRVAAMFCLLYDDNRWSIQQNSTENSPTKSTESNVSNKHSSTTYGVSFQGVEFGLLSKEQLQGMKTFLPGSDLLRVLAEVNFIYAEALVQLLKCENVNVLEIPKAPEDTKLRPKKYRDEPYRIEDAPEWLAYINWLNEISKKALKCFLRAAELGVELGESWIVCNAGIYMWNYTNHLLMDEKYSALLTYYKPLFLFLQIVGHASEIVFLCDLASALAHGYMQRYIPPLFYEPIAKLPTKDPPASKDRKSRLGNLSNQNIKMKGTSSILTADALNDLRQAMDVLEYTLTVTNGNVKHSTVAVSARYKLIQMWILCKGLMNQPLSKSYGQENGYAGSQDSMIKALCALEAVTLQSRNVVEFSPCPSVTDVIKLVENAKWTDKLLLLQVWSKLAAIAYNDGNVDSALCCANMVINLVNSKNLSKKKAKKNSSKCEYKEAVEQDMLFYASLIKAQCLVSTINGRAEVRREALNCFVDACRHAMNSNDYDLVLHAARQCWNTVHPLISVPIERRLLTDPIKSIVKYIRAVSKTKDSDHEVKEKLQQGNKSYTTDIVYSNENLETDIINLKKPTYDDDLRLRAALYCLLFQTYVDRGEFLEGLTAMDEAIKVMPRTHHRLLIFKHRVVTLARLDKQVQFDMGKFRDESESMLSEMWLRVAQHSKDKKSQISAYVNAIEVLTMEENVYQKVECLTEFSEWLFVNEYPVTKALDQLRYAASLLVNEMVDSTTRSEFSLHFTTFKEDLKFLEKIKDVRQMDTLFQLFVMLAEMSGHQHEMYKQCNLAAAFLVQQMWRTSIINAEKSMREGIKPGELTTAKAAKEKKYLHTTTRDRSAKPALPSTLELWATYEIPDKVKEYFLKDQHGRYISTSSIKKPMLSVYYLDKLNSNLASIGFDHLSVHTMLLMRYIAEEIISCKSLILLTVMKSCELFQQLNMVATFECFQKLLNVSMLPKEDQEKSREETQVWQELQRQVYLEEKRQEKNSSSASSNHRLSPLNLTKPKIGKVVLREIWTEMSTFLIRKGDYQNARLLLEEASLSARAFDDDNTISLINYNYALIAYDEKDWGRAVLLLQLSCDVASVQMSWLKKMLLLVDSLHKFSQQESTFQSHLNDGGFEKARFVLEKGVQTISRLLANKQNSTYLGSYIIARLYSRLGVILYTESKERRYKSAEEKNKLLEDACGYLSESFHKLSKGGYKRESIEMLFHLLEIRKKLALSQRENDQKLKSLLMETLEMANEAVKNVTILAGEITELSPLEKVENVFLPIQHDIVTARIHCVGIMCAIIEVELEARRTARLNTEKKKSIVRFIDNYMDKKPTLSKVDERWESVIGSVTEETLTLSTSLQMLCSNVPVLRAQASMHLGVLFSLLSKYNNGDRFDCWKQSEMDRRSLKEDLIDSPESLRDELEEHKFFLCQAVESLLCTIDLSLHHQNIKLLQRATSLLVECVGLRDQYLTVQLLALNQSCQSSLFGRTLLERALIDCHASEPAALFASNKILSQQFLNKTNTVLQSNYLALNNFECWRRLQVSKNFFEILNDMPDNITYVILQHSVDKKYLYGGVLDKSLCEVSSKKKDSFTNDPRIMIARQSTSPGLLSKLLEMCSELKVMLGVELVRQVYTEEQKKKRRELFGKANESPEEEAEELKRNEIEQNKLREAFFTLITAMEAYLGDVLVQLEKTLSGENTPDNIVILGDEKLLEFPLEGLTVFNKAGVKSLARDFSLQMFSHRLKQSNSDSGAQSKTEHKLTGKNKHDSKSVKPSNPKSGKPGNIGTQEKKNCKELATDKDIIIDLSNLKYLVDPLHDSQGVISLGEVFSNFILQSQNNTLKWTGIKGDEHVANVKDMQSLLATSQNILFYGYERLLGFIPPHLVAPLNLKECHLALLLDQAQNIKSCIRQGNLDGLKSPNDLQLESSVNTSMLLSLCGVSTVALNQWNTTIVSNTQRMENILIGLFDYLNIGQSIRKLVFPRVIDDVIVSQSDESDSPAKQKIVQVEQQSEATPSIVVLEPQQVDECHSFEKFNFVLYGLPNLTKT